MAAYADNFNRSNGALNATGVPWVVDSASSAAVVSNAAVSSGSGDVFVRYNNTTANDQVSKATYTAPSDAYWALGVRLQGLANGAGYWLYINPGGSGWEVQQLPGSGGIFSGGDSFTNGDVPELRAVGTTLSVWNNGASLGSSTDGDYTTGQTGFGAFINSGTATWDNWEGGDYSSAVSKTGTDTASLSVTESLTDTVTVGTLDDASLHLTETVSVAATASRTDTASLSVADASSVSVSNSGLIAGTDTTSLTLTEAGSVRVSITATDTASLQLTDAGTVAVTQLAKSGTDTASLTASDFGAVNAIVGATPVTASDTARLHLEDVGRVTDILPVRVMRFTPSSDAFRFTAS